MQAYRLKTLGSVDGIVLQDAHEPQPKASQIVIRVRAMSLNRRDAMILNGVYPLPSKENVVPLSDGAGEVVAIGSAVTRFKIGERVTGSYFPRWLGGRLSADLIDQLGCTLDGMLTEYALLDEQWAVALPDHLTWEEGATLTCAAVTAWNSIMGPGILRPGQSVLTLGTGGVSLFALQFAKLMGCTVIAATSRDEKFERLRALGADHVINHAQTPDWGQAVRELTGGRGADLVVEATGPATIGQSLVASALYGRVVLLITQSGDKRILEIPGSAYARSLATISRVFVGNRADLEATARAVAAHRLRPVIDRVFPFAEAREAYRYFMEGDLFGKVIVQGS
jgi:NADPH:quinone reductase-like Zn-dependent oxidoreductase